jgi:tRNA A37 threonylcarbamoyladenosine modification protein TsaB
MDAARGEVFAARYQRSRQSPTGVVAIDEPVSARPDVVAAHWRDRGPGVNVWIGDGVARYRDRLPNAARSLSPPVLAPLIGMLALARRAEAGAPHALRPLYVRPPDAELARKR